MKILKSKFLNLREINEASLSYEFYIKTLSKRNE